MAGYEKRRWMIRSGANNRIIVLAFLIITLLTKPILAILVDLEFRVISANNHEGQIIEIDLFAISNSDISLSIAAIEIVLNWDQSRLLLLDHKDPCEQSPCPKGTFDWSNSDFPDDSNAEGLNDTFDDGQALYRAFSSFDAELQAPVSSEGLWVTTLRFRSVGEGLATIDLLGDDTFEAQTGVIGGSPVTDITGFLGDPIEISIDDPCLVPTVEEAGSRYISIQPILRFDPVALRIFGDFQDERVACIAQFIRPDGTISTEPFFQTTDQWGVVWVADHEIIPDATYFIQTVCEEPNQLGISSATVQVSTWIWGDTNADDAVGIDDLSSVIDGVEGNFGEEVTLANLDVVPCRPDGILDQADIDAINDALQGGEYPCSQPCTPGFNLDDYAQFLACWADVAPPQTSCLRFDLFRDDRVDLRDLGILQIEFRGPG